MAVLAETTTKTTTGQKRRGVHMGRPVVEAPPDFEETVIAWEKKKITMEEAMKRCGIGETTFYRRRREMRLIKGKSC